MRTVIAFLIGLVTMAVYSRYDVQGVFYLYLASVVIVLSGMYIRDRIRQVNTLKAWGQKVGPIAVYAEDPSNPEQVRTIYIRAEEIKKWLEVSQNQFAYVVPIYYRDHQNINETHEEYLQRVQDTIAKERIKSLPPINYHEGESFFLKHVADQRGVK